MTPFCKVPKYGESALQAIKRFTIRFQVFGGKRGIRTLERVLTVTRFPIVRLRPAQPSFHIYLTIILYHISRNLSSTFLKKYVKPGCPGSYQRLFWLDWLDWFC